MRNPRVRHLEFGGVLPPQRGGREAEQRCRHTDSVWVRSLMYLPADAHTHRLRPYITGWSDPVTKQYFFYSPDVNLNRPMSVLNFLVFWFLSKKNPKKTIKQKLNFCNIHDVSIRCHQRDLKYFTREREM